MSIKPEGCNRWSINTSSSRIQIFGNHRSPVRPIAYYKDTRGLTRPFGTSFCYTTCGCGRKNLGAIRRNLHEKIYFPPSKYSSAFKLSNLNSPPTKQKVGHPHEVTGSNLYFHYLLRIGILERQIRSHDQNLIQLGLRHYGKMVPPNFGSRKGLCIPHVVF